MVDKIPDTLRELEKLFGFAQGELRMAKIQLGLLQEKILALEQFLESHGVEVEKDA